MKPQDFPVKAKNISLRNWREETGWSQGRVARALSLLAPEVLGRPLPVSQQRIGDLEHGTRPSRDLLLLLAVLTRGRVDANALYEIPDWRQFEAALQVLEGAA